MTTEKRSDMIGTAKSKKRVKLCLKIAITVVLGALLLINLLTVVFSELGLRRSLDWMPGAFISIGSGSMEPELHKGDLAFVWRTAYEDLEIGDIVTTLMGDEYVTHSIVRLDTVNERIVTKGLQNNLEDAPVGKEQYCARMLFSVPGGARYFDMLKTPVVTVLLLLLIALLFFGVPFFNALYDLVSRNRGRSRRVGSIRVLLALLTASFVLVTPVMTAAKYFVELNGLAMSSAEAVYFSSNFLSPESNDYRIQGWDGNAYVVELDIRNFSNELLFNVDGVDVPYTLRCEKVEEAGFETDYTCRILVPEGKEYRPLVTPEAPAEEPASPSDLEGVPGEYDAIPHDDRPRQDYYQLNGNDEGGKLQSFSVRIDAENEMTPGQKIKFRITAETIPTYLYHQVMSAEYTLEVASAGSFLGARSFQQSPGSTLVTYTLKTNQIAGISHRTVVIEWDPENLYINEYDPTYLSLMERNGNSLDAPNGRLTLSLQAFSSINLQFFKYSGKLSIPYTDWHEVRIADNVEYDYIELFDENRVTPPDPET